MRSAHVCNGVAEQCVATRLANATNADGGGLVVLRALGEGLVECLRVGNGHDIAALILAEQQQYFPITKAIYALVTSLGDGPHLASALGVWAMAFLAITIVGAGVILGKKLGALFRV